MAIIVFSLLYYGIGLWLLPRVQRFVTAHQIVEKNFKQKLIPTAMGIFIGAMLIVYVILLSTLVELAPFQSMAKFIEMSKLSSYLLALFAVCFVGWLDDTIGAKDVKGFAGHWRRWKTDKVMTTGWIKMWTTGALALWMCSQLLSIGGEAHPFINFSLVIIKFLLMTLMTNTLNLLDVRPGRALKFYGIFIVLLAALSTPWTAYIAYMLPVVICALILLKPDLRGSLMMGDTGSNVLGFALGYCLCIAVPISMQMTIVMLLIAMHWVAAKSSITYVIAKVNWLNRLDEWGRK